jgi:hypothetical protein
MNGAKTGKPSALRPYEEWTSLLGSESHLSAQGLKRSREVGRERNQALLVPFTPQEDLSWTREMEVGCIHTDRLRNPGACASEEEQESIVTSAKCCLAVRSIQERIDLRGRQIPRSLQY